MKYFIILFLLSLTVFCTVQCTTVKVDTIQVAKSNELFTSTQKYQIFCWLIKKHEGFEAGSYRCQAGKKTVGWGFTNVKSVKDIHHADEIFRDIVNPLFDQVSKEYSTLTYLQKAVVTSLYYNSGSLKKIRNSNFSKNLKNNNVKEAITSFKKWNKVRVGKNSFIVSKGLVKRRSYESKLLAGTFTMDDYNKLKKEVSNIYLKNK